MDKTQKTILKAALLMPILYPVGIFKKVWYKLFPKKGDL